MVNEWRDSATRQINSLFIEHRTTLNKLAAIRSCILHHLVESHTTCSKCIYLSVFRNKSPCAWSLTLPTDVFALGSYLDQSVAIKTEREVIERPYSRRSLIATETIPTEPPIASSLKLWPSLCNFNQNTGNRSLQRTLSLSNYAGKCAIYWHSCNCDSRGVPQGGALGPHVSSVGNILHVRFQIMLGNFKL